MNPIIPTVGRVVYFTPSCISGITPDFNTGVCAALVTAVHNYNCVNLSVLDANGQHHARCSVCHVSTVSADDDVKKYDTWDWMPYQKGQAAKTEQLEAKLGDAHQKPSLAYCQQTGSLCNAEDLAIEQQIQAKGLNAPRLTPKDIDAKILGADYQRFNGTTVTICCLYLENGFTVTGESACASPENFDAEIGKKIAYQNAREKIWQLEGYLLRQRLHNLELSSKPICVPTIEDVAEACHNINRAYCQAIGDDSQPTWADAPEWQKSSAINGVKFHLENPSASPSASHDSWLAQKVAEGWVYGEVKDAEKKTHPCCVSYDDLPKEQKAKDYLFKQTVHSFVPFIFQEEPLIPHNTINS